jgi:transcriptional regulator
VPTWNYATVHACGVPAIIEDRERIVSVLNELVKIHEFAFAQPWPGDLPDDFRDKMIQGIVAFEIPITRLEGKFKLGQNRSAADLQGVFEALSQSDDPESRALAQLMLEEGFAKESA